MLRAHEARSQEDREENREFRRRFDLVINGDPPDRPGLMMQVDRLRNTVGRYTKAVWIVFTGIVGGLATAVAAVFQ